MTLAASLAFAPLATDDVATTDSDGGASVALTATATDATISGTLAFGGAATTGVDGAGDASAPGVGLDVGDLRIEQRGPDLLFTLDVLDTVNGDVAPTALYRVDLPNNLALLAYRGPGIWNYQLADFSDGYSRGDAEGSFDGSSITWTIPANTIGGAGAQIAPGYLSSMGASPGGVTSLQLTGFVQVDTGNPILLFSSGGSIAVEVTDAEGAVVLTDTTVASNGTWSIDLTDRLADLAAGEYTVTATSAYADTEGTAVTTLTVADAAPEGEPTPEPEADPAA